MASSRPIIAPERSRRGRKYTASPLAIKAHLCYTPVIAYDFCRERLPGETFERPQQVGRAIESGYDDRERNHIREF